MSQVNRFDFEALRLRLAGANGKDLWRSLDELADTPEFREFLEHEFPAGADVWPRGMSRRGFVKLAGVSLALAGITACARQPLEPIVPYVVAPADRVQGQAQWFATALPQRGYGIGVLAKSFEGRPVKIEGNPDHPGSQGSTDAFAQAALYALYDPDRSQNVRRRGTIVTWDDFAREVIPAFERQRAVRGAGLRILTEPVSSPTLVAQLQSILAQLPLAKWHQYESCGRENVYAGTRMALGAPLEPSYHFDRAEVVVALDSNFLMDEPGSVKYSRDFSARRRVSAAPGATMNRLYAIEPMLTVTGAMADHRLPRKGGEVVQYARALAARIAGGQREPLGADDDRWLDAVARDLAAHRGSALIIAGDSQPPLVHALAHAMTAALGGVGTTTTYTAPVLTPLSGIESLQSLARDLDSGAVEMLLVLGGNPAYTAPADLDFQRRMGRAKLSVHLSQQFDETSSGATWHLPESHPLEAWSDLRAFDGTASIVQPLIDPLYDSRSAHEVLTLITGAASRGHDTVKAFWRAQPQAGADFETWWRATLARGVAEATSAPPVTAASDPAVIHRLLAAPAAPRNNSVEVNFRTDPTIGDGRHATNAWLQELPKPISKLVWDNAVIVGPRLAERLHLDNEQVMEIGLHGRRIEGPVWIIPGVADDSIILHLGYGRQLPGTAAEGAGFNAGAIRFSDAFANAGGVSVRATSRTRQLVSSQQHNTLAGRDHVRAATLAQFVRNPDFVREPEKEPARDETMYPPFKYDGHAWAMSIDLNSCIGCNACVVACVSENNIPTVGREQVSRGREMQWLRIDRYYSGSLEDPVVFHEPIMCMHCEEAPCEVVCPVGATLHSSEGLNEMVYNRCVGTRYCSNNCPYKVRHFNFFHYTAKSGEIQDLMYNPDVTVRTRGVMEKCTYCVQRIEQARIRSANEERPIRDGEIVTACQQACPAQAIVFGDRNDPGSRVSKLKSQSRDYSILSELNTRPRTTYLGKLRNPNPELEEEKA